MSDNTGIEWTDATWNPVTGCTKVSPGCDHCYAETFAERFRGVPGHHFERGFDVVLRPERLDIPLRWKKPRRIFVNSMSDLFHDAVPDEFIARVFAVMSQARQHTFQVLTKRHGRMRSLLSSERWPHLVAREAFAMDRRIGEEPFRLPLPNVWLGVSAEDQQRAAMRIPALGETPAAVRWVSFEPLLGSVFIPGEWLEFLDWAVVGGESGRGARPMHPDWARLLRDQCRAAGIPFLFKQWGEWGPLAQLDAQGRFDWSGGHSLANDGTLYGPHDLVYPDGPRYGEALRADHGRAHLTSMYRLGKKKAGRDLDGRTWDEYPQAATA